MSKFYITGVPGTGKSTVAEELRKRNIPVLDVDAVPGLCYWRNRMNHAPADYEYGIGKDWLDAHEWICDPEKMKALINGATGHLMIVGLAENQDGFFHLFDKVFLLHCSQDIFLQRLSTRGGENQFAQDASEQEHILSRYEDFERGTLVHGAIPINTGEKSAALIVDEIVAQF